MEESSYIHKSHNVTALIYHLVTPAKYRKVIFNQELDEYLCTICNGIEDRYEIRFLEIGTDDDHVHFLRLCCMNRRFDVSPLSPKYWFKRYA